MKYSTSKFLILVALAILLICPGFIACAQDTSTADGSGSPADGLKVISDNDIEGYGIRYENEYVIVTASNTNNFYAENTVRLIPIKKALSFPVEFVDEINGREFVTGDVIRFRNMYDRRPSKMLIHSKEGIFDDYVIMKNYDMYIQFNKAGTYTIELYDGSRSVTGDLIPYNGGPSSIVVTVAEK